MGMTICLAPRGGCGQGVSFTIDLPGLRSSVHFRILFPGKKRRTKRPPAGYPASLQYLQSGRVRKIVVFNVGGNRYRLIAIVSYPKGKVYIQHVLTHKEYDRVRGKTTEVRPPDRTSDRHLVLIRELPLRPLRSDGELDQAIAMIDRLRPG